MACIIFLSQLVAAGCLCRPVVVMGGLWVGILVLVQAILALKAAHSSTPTPTNNVQFNHALLVGCACVSGVVCVVCLAAAAYLFSGHLTLACVSAFHRPDHASVVRLYVVEVVGLVASLPSLTAAILALLSAAIAARAAYPPKPKKAETPFVLYLPRWGEAMYGSDQHTLPRPGPAPTPPTANQSADRTTTPPPAYNQVAEESYA